MGAFDLPDAAAAALAAGARLGWLRRLGLGWAHGLLSRVCVAILPDAAAAALPPVRFWAGCAAWVSAGCLACVSCWCGYPAGYCCGGYAAGALLGWLCRLGLGWAPGFRLAWVRLSCGGAGHVDAPQLCWTLPPLFSLANNRPLSEGAAGVSRLGERGISAIPYDFV